MNYNYLFLKNSKWKKQTVKGNIQRTNYCKL